MAFDMQNRLVLELTKKEIQMSIYDELKSDHVKVINTISELIEVKEDTEKARLLINQLRDQLIPHVRAEEAVLYNSLRSLDLLKPLISHSYREHIEAETLLRTLQVKVKTHMDWHELAKKLKDALLDHINEEETVLFSEAKKTLKDEEAEQMGVAFLKLKPEIKEEGLTANMLELTANLMPTRFAKYMRSFNLESRI